MEHSLIMSKAIYFYKPYVDGCRIISSSRLVTNAYNYNKESFKGKYFEWWEIKDICERSKTDTLKKFFFAFCFGWRSRHVSPYISWLMSASEVSVFIAPLSDDGLVSVDVGGCVRTWETSVVNLKRSLQEWRNMIGYEDSRPLQARQFYVI